VFIAASSEAKKPRQNITFCVAALSAHRQKLLLSSTAPDSSGNNDQAVAADWRPPYMCSLGAQCSSGPELNPTAHLSGDAGDQEVRDVPGTQPRLQVGVIEGALGALEQGALPLHCVRKEGLHLLVEVLWIAVHSPCNGRYRLTSDLRTAIRCTAVQAQLQMCLMICNTGLREWAGPNPAPYTFVVLCQSCERNGTRRRGALDMPQHEAHLGGRQLVDDAVAGLVADQDAAHVARVVADAAAGGRVAAPRLGGVQVRQVRLRCRGGSRFAS
jgi:hypothetical protein